MEQERRGNPNDRMVISIREYDKLRGDTAAAQGRIRDLEGAARGVLDWVVQGSLSVSDPPVADLARAAQLPVPAGGGTKTL